MESVKSVERGTKHDKDKLFGKKNFNSLNKNKFKLISMQAIFALFVCLASVQAQDDVDEQNWISILKTYLELQKSSVNFIGSSPDFEQRLNTFINIVRSHIEDNCEI